ncbi:hypothetical protein [Acidicapsa acidisoli]|uniref:hypothetical protein n=1 Tax=Acidicapsa acidisoli TaxID=1615681 RepID=UPI0021E04B01|nr:hypothetical protein [Acidicapsa acidisoli]
MDVYMWEDKLDRWHKLLTRDKQLPEAALSLTKGGWKLEHVVLDLAASDVRLALDSQKAVKDLDAAGFHEFSVQITTTINS